MAAAYAALVSLMNVIKRIQYSCPVSFDQSQIQSLYDGVNSLVDFLEAYSQIISDALAEKMVAAAFAAEDTIESYIVSQLTQPANTVRRHTKHNILSDFMLERIVSINIRRRRTPSKFVRGRIKSNIVRRLSCWRTTVESTIERTIESDEDLMCYGLEKAHKEIDLILQEAMEVKEKNGSIDQLSRGVVHVALSAPSSETIMTEGFDEQLNHLIDQLSRADSSRQIHPVVGMGGIGKTTLARSVYKHKSLRYHFDIIGWVTVSQVFTAASIIRPLLSDMGEKGHVEDENLGETLHKYLFSRRYLIILDDIWDNKAWDVINMFLPNNNNGSRILLTTRLCGLARSVGSYDSYEMKLLDGDKSWDLLSKKVFGPEVCPLELENCGKRIAKSCKGLPLALVLIGGLLKTSDITLEYWEDVAKNISSIISGEDNERCLEILSLSYHQLPIHLKPCFLYMATYPEDHQIKVSDVIKLWAADGFLKPNADELPEEIAKKYLIDLIDRNLIVMSELDGLRILSMHDLVRELSIREAKKGIFVYVNGASVETTKNQRRLVAHDDRKFSLDILGKGSARSLICFSPSYRQYDVSDSRLLRVFSDPFFKLFLPEDILQLINLRFLRFSMGKRPFWPFSSISSLWNLETLMVDNSFTKSGEVSLPCDIWKLRHIKHIVFTCVFTMPETPTSKSLLENLETLSIVNGLSAKVLNKIPNIKHLEIDNWRGLVHHTIPDMVQCYKLEKLGIRSHSINLKIQMFPDSIRVLRLGYCKTPWESMTTIGSLPNLEILVISNDGFKGEKWTTGEGEFQNLRCLFISRCYLVNWRIEDSSHFPSLEHLRLGYMSGLEEIPEVFGESMTLQTIEMMGCGDSVVASAKRILEEHQSMDNYEFTLQIY